MDVGERERFCSGLERTFPMVANHPDVAGLLRQADVIARIGAALAQPFSDAGVTLVMAPEARGPILGSLVANELEAGLVLARKSGQNHPGADVTIESEPTWRGHSQTFQLRSFDFSPSDRVLVVDDWITTGSSMRVLVDAIRSFGSTYVGAAVLVDKASPTVLSELDVHPLVRFSSLTKNR